MCERQLGECGDSHGETLERLDPTGEQQHWMIAEAEGQAGAGPIPGREERVVDTRRDDLDTRRISAIELHELGDLIGAVGEDGIGASDDRCLGRDASVGFVVAGLSLHSGQRVKRGDEREREFMLEAMAGHTREPIIRMDGVGVVVTPEMFRYAIGELVNDRG